METSKDAKGKVSPGGAKGGRDGTVQVVEVSDQESKAANGSKEEESPASLANFIVRICFRVTGCIC
jgi:hypothetical protein